MAFGVLTTLTDAQAEQRAAPGPGNKGREAAQAAIDMAALLPRLTPQRVRP
jgi:6,7-dimethyl-8-ribityllumazine synthase